MTDGDYADVLDRREFLALTGATGAAALVGGSGAAGAQSEGSVYDVTHESATSVNPANVQFNPTNTANLPSVAQDLLFEPFARYNYQEAAYRPAGIEAWEYTDDAFVLTVREGLTWSNGDPVTAEDVVTQLRIAEYEDDPMWEWAESVEAIDSRNVSVSVGEDVNPDLIERDVLDRWLQQDRATYGEFLTDLENEEATIGDLREFADEDPVTNGPFTLESRTEAELRASRFDDHPDADEINFGEYAFTNFGASQQRTQALLDLDVDSDYALTVQGDTVADFPDAVEEVQTPDVFGMGLAPNFDDPIAGDRAIRQAISYVVNRERAVQNSYAHLKDAPEVQTGISTYYQDEWLGDEMDAFETYGVDESRTDEAAAVLEDAGYRQTDDGVWLTEDDDPVSVEITIPSGWSDWTMALETVTQELADFGIGAGITATEDYFGAIADGDFQFVANTWLHGGPTAHPYYSLRHQLVEPQLHACHTNYPGYTEQYGGSAAARTVPARSGDGETTLTLAEAIADLAATDDEAEEQELVRDLAWLANQDLPRIPLVEKQIQQWFTTDEWVLPDDLADHGPANVSRAPTALLREGDLQYAPPDEATVTVSGAPDVLTRGESAEVAVAVAGLPADVEDLTVDLAVGDADVAFLTRVALADGVEGSTTPVPDRSTVRIEVDGTDFEGTTRTQVATVRVAGRGHGETAIEPTVESVATSGPGGVTTTTQSTTVVVGEADLAPVAGEVPIDHDGDGLHEDVNADGTANLADAGDLFQHRGDPAVTDYADAYDFSGNGEVDLADVVQLFQENT